MHSNGTVIYFDPLSADQPVSAANDTPAADNTSGDTTLSKPLSPIIFISLTYVKE